MAADDETMKRELMLETGKREHFEEEYVSAHRALDSMKVPRTLRGNTLSLVGRIQALYLRGRRK